MSIKSAPQREAAPVLVGRRSSGLLMHPTSLPGPHGNGDAGPGAFEFVDFLRAAGQMWWQMLPVGPPGARPGYSPYSSTSAFAGSPYLISLELLHRDGLLEKGDLAAPASVSRQNDPDDTRDFRLGALWRAYGRFWGDRKNYDAFVAFCAQHDDWLDDFALFCAAKLRFKDKPWTAWPKPLRTRQRAAIKELRHLHDTEIRFFKLIQYFFDRQWTALRNYAQRRGRRPVGLIGDIPIFVALDSADVWANPNLFVLDRDGQPTIVSGCPPDAFTCDGQLWGHPHYDWAAHRREKFDWWVRRFRSMLHRFDAVRIDHFLGFHQAWAVPAGARTAAKGRYIAGPGDEIFRAVRKAIGDIPVIAEDLGAVTPEALALRDRWSFPGMRVMQFGFGDGGEYHLPHTYAARSVAYTGTHDNDTTVGWFRNLSSRNGQAISERRKARDYLGARGARDVHWQMIRAAMLSVADTVIFPVQDVLGLGNEARMNIPGVAENNWRWRMRDGALTPALARKLQGLTELSDRGKGQ